MGREATSPHSIHCSDHHCFRDFHGSDLPRWVRSSHHLIGGLSHKVCRNCEGLEMQRFCFVPVRLTYSQDHVSRTEHRMCWTQCSDCGVKKTEGGEKKLYLTYKGASRHVLAIPTLRCREIEIKQL